MIIHLLLMVGIAYVEPHLPEQSPKCMKIDGAWEASGVHGMLKWTWGCLRLFGWFLQTTLNTNTWLHSEGPNRQYPIYQKKTFRGSVCECFALYFSLIHSRFGPTSIYPHISSGTPRCWWGPCCRTLSCWPSSPWVLHWSSWPHFAGSPRETSVPKILRERATGMFKDDVGIE